MSIYITLGIQEVLPSWLVILVVSRDVLIVGAIILTSLLGLSVTIVPSKLSKLNTFCQIALAALVLGDIGFDVGFTEGIELFVFIVAGTTVLSGLTYILQWARQNS